MDATVSHTINQARSYVSATALPATASGRSIEDIQKVAKEFEAVFLSESLRLLFQDIEVDPLFGGGTAEEVYRDMLLNEYGKNLTERGGVGIADHVAAQLLQLQEVR